MGMERLKQGEVMGHGGAKGVIEREKRSREIDAGCEHVEREVEGWGKMGRSSERTEWEQEGMSKRKKQGQTALL